MSLVLVSFLIPMGTGHNHDNRPRAVTELYVI